MNKINFLEKLSLAEGVHIPDSAWNLIQEAKITSDFEQVFILSKAKKDYMPFQVEYDLKVFIALLEYAHIGKVFAFSDSISLITHELLSKASSVNDSAELQNMIECTLKQHIIDGHTQIYGPNGFSSMMQSVEPYFADVVLVENDGVYIIEEGFENEGAVFQYEHIKKHIFETLPGKNNTKRYLLGSLSSTKVDFLDINGYRFILHLSKTNIAQNKEELILDVVDNLPIIYDPSYNHFDDSTRLKKYESIAKELKDKPLFIWNLVNNGGGTDQYSTKFINTLNGRSELDMTKVTMFYREENQKCILYHEIHEHTEFSESRFKGKAIVIVNNHVYSSAEVAVLYSKLLTNTIIVGTNTGGVNQFGNIEGYLLPNSKIVVMLPTTAFFHGLMKENIGILPDYWIDSDKPIDDILKWIKS